MTFKTNLERYIINTEIENLLLPRLFDAHRHGLYDINEKFSMMGVPIEKWSNHDQFIAYDKSTKFLTKDEIYEKLEPWIDFSLQEGVGVIFDISGKQYGDFVNTIYNKKNIKQLTAEYWNNWNPNCGKVKLLILPDESLLSEKVIQKSLEFLKTTNGILMLHCLESNHRLKTAQKKWGMSTVEWLSSNNLLTSRTYLVHLNYATIRDYNLILQNKSHVVFCPAMRKALNNSNPPIIPEEINLHFGTDGPIATQERSIWKQARIQSLIWQKQGMSQYKAVKRAVLALFSSPFEDNSYKINFYKQVSECEVKSKFYNILYAGTEKSQLDYEIIKGGENND